MTLLALPWLVLQTTGSPTRMSLVVAADVAPVVLLSVPLGATAGRLGLRRALLGGDLARALLVALIALLQTAGMLSFPLLLGLVFVQGMLWAPYYASQGALIPQLLGDEPRTLTRGLALFHSASRTTYFLGPALGGALIAAFGPVAVLWVDAASYLVAAALLAAFLPAQVGVPVSAGGQGVWSGLRALLDDRLLRGWTVTSSLSQMAYQTLVLALPLLAFARYRQDPAVAGLLLGGWGAGALAGSLASLRTPSTWRPLVLGTVAWLVQALVLWLLVVPLPAAAAVAVLVVSGLANGLRVPPLRTIITRRIPAARRVQVLAAETAVPFSAGLLAVVLAGPAAEAFGVTALLVACAAIATAGALGFVRTVLTGDVAESDSTRL
jgi:MFS family permease